MEEFEVLYLQEEQKKSRKRKDQRVKNAEAVTESSSSINKGELTNVEMRFI